MKIVLNAVALSLILTGAFASTQINRSSDTIQGKVGAMPVPLCPPDDPNGCHLWDPPHAAPAVIQ